MINVHAVGAAAFSIAFDGVGFRYLDANRAMLDLCGLATTFQPGVRPEDVFSAAVAARVNERYRTCCTGEAISYVAIATVGDEPRRWRTTLFSAGNVGGWPCVLYGIAIRIADEQAEETVARDLPALALDLLDGGFWTLDLNSGEFHVSQQLTAMLVGPRCAPLTLPDYVACVHAGDLNLDMPESDAEIAVEFRVLTHDGRVRWLRTRRRRVHDATGRATHLVGVVMDITEQKIALLRLEEEASTDELTAVGNRRAFERASEHRFVAGGRFGVGDVVERADRALYARKRSRRSLLSA